MEQQAPVNMILLNNNYLGNVRQWQDLMSSAAVILHQHY